LAGPINSKLESFDNSELVIKTAEKADIVAKQAYIQAKSYDEVWKMAMNKEKMILSIPAIMPIANKDLKHTASGWGFRIHPIYKIKQFHYGMDFSAPVGTKIYATGDGVVKDIETSKIGFGKWVVIDHGYGYETLYGHMSRFKVQWRTRKTRQRDWFCWKRRNFNCATPALRSTQKWQTGKPAILLLQGLVAAGICQNG
jgi:murein DD-endopeptidase MepM/ murein hydrolase activator NlpD